MSYAWIIDKDHLFPLFDGDDSSAVGVTGPSNAPDALLARLALKTPGHVFRIYDDDGQLYYTGRALFREQGEMVRPENSEYALGPLDDFGTPNAGATEIRYFIDGHWQSI
jgi:hypothetical protein